MARKIVCCLKPGAISHYACVSADILQQIAPYGFDFIYCEKSDEFIKNLPEAEVVIAADFKPEWISLAPKLRWVATNAAGKERIAEDALVERGIKVTFGRFHGKIMAETVIGMMLFTARGLGVAYQLQTKVPWCDTSLFDQAVTLRGKTCIILGLGSIGKYVAQITKCFGMYNIGVKRSISLPVNDVDKMITIDSLKNYLPQADHLVIILPNIPATDNFINAEMLALLKPTACLYNVGRGNCIDESALYQALKDHKLKWACLDVFKTEPLPADSPLRNLNNMLILPHSSAFAPEYYQLFFEEFVRDLGEYVKQTSR